MAKTMKAKKKLRARGSGSVYKIGRVWWIAYKGADGRRKAESTESERKGDAERLLQRRNGAREYNLPVIPKAEQLTFDTAAQDVVIDFKNNSKPSLPVLQRRIDKHLRPFFGGWRMANITSPDIAKYVRHRQVQGIVAWKGKRKGERIGDVSNTEINHELKALSRMFGLAIQSGLIGSKPHIAKLSEPKARQGFFEPEQMTSVLAHLPPELAAVVEFGYLTGWRVESEVLPLEWRRVDFKEGSVRLDAGTTKNGEARVVYMTAALRHVLEARNAERLRLQKAGTIVQHVFFRMIAKGRGGELEPKPIGSFKRAWRNACRAAGVPGKLLHDLRRTAVRDLDRKGVSRSVAMKLVGHRTESMYERYNITSDNDLRDAARKLDAAAVPVAPLRTARRK